MPPFGKTKEKFQGGLLYLTSKRKIRRGSAAVLFFLLLTTFISFDFMPRQLDLEVGDVSRENIYAPRTVVFEDRVKTEEKKILAEQSIGSQYTRDDGIEPAVIKDISNVIRAVGEIQKVKDITSEERISHLEFNLPFKLSQNTLEVLVKPNDNSLQELNNSLINFVSEAMNSSSGVTRDNMDDITGQINTKIDALKVSKAYMDLGKALVKYFIRPNTTMDEEKTRLIQLAARESVPPVMVTIRKEEKIIGAGEVVSREHLMKLEALGLLKVGAPWRALSGCALLVVILMVVVLLYLYQQRRDLYSTPGYLYLLGIIVLLVLLVARGVLSIELSRSPDFGSLLGFMVPVAAAGMLITILIDSRLAVLIVCILSFILSIMAEGQVSFGVVGMVGGITGVYSVSKLSQRADLARAGFYTSAANIVTIMVMGLINNTPLPLIFSSAFILGIVNGILSSILTNGALPYLENVFGITSAVRLLELSQPSNPVLRKLLTEAPGTYHHSILVGNLAEAAAEAVGGESLLVRVGAYYHDIGKIKRPYFFIENQLACDNPHDKIAPSLSTLILTSHVRDGLDLAREYKLPQTVVRFVEQHHGTSLVTYFYHKATENGNNVNEEEFRYEGPKPQTKEVAVVMLADSVEAAVRSMQNRTQGRVEGLVRKIIRDKLMDGQLDECDLTFKDLEKIAEAFTRILSGIFHSRIEYPDLTREIERRKIKRDSFGRKSAARD